MTFPNAAKGIKKLFRAEFLMMISELITIPLLFLIGDADTDYSGVPGFIVAEWIVITISLITVVLAIVGDAIEVVGLVQATRDDGTFRGAIYAIAVSMIICLAAAIFKNNSFLQGLSGTVSMLMTFAVIVMVTAGIGNLSAKMGDEALQTKGRKVFIVVMCVMLVELLAKVIVFFFNHSLAPAVIITLSGVVMVLTVVQYVVYLSYLSQAGKALSK